MSNLTEFFLLSNGGGHWVVFALAPVVCTFFSESFQFIFTRFDCMRARVFVFCRCRLRGMVNKGLLGATRRKSFVGNDLLPYA